MHIKKVFVELKRRKQVEYLTVLIKLKKTKQDFHQLSIRYQKTKLFGGYFGYFLILNDHQKV
jgi:hypothetical protein